jgi:predicted enzyme related to lactoylglutathione lyase
MSAKPTGTFCWADLLPVEQGRAIDFYAELAGWNAAVGGAEFGGYALAFGGGDVESPSAMAAGLNPSIATIRGFHESAGREAPPMEPGWTVYLATEDLEATVASVLAAGGQQLIPRMDVPGMGASTLCADPTGAAFGLWQSTGHDGFGVFGEPGAFCWAEVYSTDVAASRDFFVEALGLESTTLRESPEFTYYQLTVPGQAAASFGVMQMPASLGDAPSHLGAYLFVSGVDAAAARAAEQGGAVVNTPFDSPFGRMATLTDSEGATINIVDPSTATGAM